MKKYKKIIIALLLISVGAAAYAYFFVWNKPFKNIKSSKVNYSVTAEQLYKEFSADEKAAMNKYAQNGKETVILVTGKLIAKEKDQDNREVLVLETSDPIDNVRCNMEEPAGNVAVGQVIKIKGQCSGYMSGVYMKRCYLSK